MTYEELLILSDEEKLIVKEKPLLAHEGRIKGRRVAIKCDMPTANCHTLAGMAEHLEVSEEFLAETLECYRKKY